MTESLGLATEWLLRNVQDDGSVPYQYAIHRAEYDWSNNEVRQLLISRLLAQMATESEILLRCHRRNLSYVLSNWYRETQDGLGYTFRQQKSKVGAIGVALQTLVASPDHERFLGTRDRLAATILSLVDKRGAIQPWFRSPSYPYDATRLLYFYIW